MRGKALSSGKREFNKGENSYVTGLEMGFCCNKFRLTSGDVAKIQPAFFCTGMQ